MRRALTDKPALGVLIGAFAIAFSGILYRKADVSPSTGAFFRCLWALPPLWLLAVREDRRVGPRPMRVRRAAWLAGVVLRGRPHPLALLDRVRRSRPGHGARQHAGRRRRPPRVGVLRRAAGAELAARDSGRHDRDHPHLRRAGERRVRRRSQARRDLRPSDRDRVLGLPACDAPGIGRARSSCGPALRRNPRQHDLHRPDWSRDRGPRLHAVAGRRRPG